jgi:chemotaxis protein histidine kinase CheA
VDFETAEGQGTTFRLRLPMNEAAAEALKQKAGVTQA